jgi:hypothetical protein
MSIRRKIIRNHIGNGHCHEPTDECDIIYTLGIVCVFTIYHFNVYIIHYVLMFSLYCYILSIAVMYMCVIDFSSFSTIFDVILEIFRCDIVFLNFFYCMFSSSRQPIR